MEQKRSAGFWWVVVPGIFLLVVLVLGQTMAFIDYDFTISIGLQEPVSQVTEMGVAVNKGFGVGDTVVYLPLLVFGLIGLWLRKPWGVFAMAGALAITAYWPVVSMFLLLFARSVPGFNFTHFLLYGIILSLITVYGAAGFFYLFKHRKEFIS